MERRRRKAAVVSGLVALGVLSLRVGEAGESPGRVQLHYGERSGVSTGEATVTRPLQSAYTRLDDIADGCQIFSICMSDLPNQSCGSARKRSVPAGGFLLVVGIRIPSGSGLRRGTWRDLGVLLRTHESVYTSHGALGEVILQEVDGRTKGTLLLGDVHFNVVGEFSAVPEPATP